jgi:chromosome segregation ATPase
MSEDTTRDMPEPRSVEERLLARLDSMDEHLQSIEARLDSVETRLQAVEVQAERRALETKPIWERALAEIIEVKERLGALEELSRQMLRKIDVLNKDMLTMRADQLGLEARLDKLEPTNVS